MSTISEARAGGLSSGWLTGAVALVAMFVGAGAAAACDTPVYRYAMYRWPPTPYEIYCFQQGPASEREQQVAAAVHSVAADAETPANVYFQTIDAADQAAVAALPADVRGYWQARPSSDAPAYLVVSPLGALVGEASLDPAEVAALVDSPARRQIAQQLAAGKCGVLLVLSSSDAAADAAALVKVEKLQEDVAAGRIELFQPPGAKPSPAADAGDNDAPTGSRLEVAIVRVARDDDAERWLVRSLLAVEGDLAELDAPMVFTVYGRGRVLPPLVGAGVSAENLVQSVEFVTGACSCTVKEQNPGVDLLMTYNWEAAAIALKDRFGAEEGNEELGFDLFPQLVLPGEAAVASLEPPVAADEPAPRPVVRGPVWRDDRGGPAVTQRSDGHEHAGGGSHDEGAHGAESSQVGVGSLLTSAGLALALGALVLAVGTWFILTRR